MQAQRISVSIPHNSSFSLECHAYKSFLKVWHYHPELELVIILESTGTRFVGDSIEKFEPGEIVLIGKNLPHLWLNDKIYFEEASTLKVKAHVIHFPEDFAGSLLQIPEMSCIRELLAKARCGIRFEGKANEKIIRKAKKMFAMDGYDRIITLLDVLKKLSEHTNPKILASAGYENTFRETSNNRIVRIHEYIMHNFRQEISLENVAELAHMNPCAFSRYFKNIQKKTFTQFLNEVRIGYACKLLLERKYNIAEVCYASGFNNISNFNRQFKSLKKVSPTEYIKMHAHLN